MYVWQKGENVFGVIDLASLAVIFASIAIIMYNLRSEFKIKPWKRFINITEVGRMQKIGRCPQCDTPMEFKGEVEDFSQDGSTIFYQCPKCKSIKLYARQYNRELRTEYP